VRFPVGEYSEVLKYQHMLENLCQATPTVLSIATSQKCNHLHMVVLDPVHL